MVSMANTPSTPPPPPPRLLFLCPELGIRFLSDHCCLHKLLYPLMLAQVLSRSVESTLC